MIKICQECGKQFETSSGTKKFCDGKHFRTCKVCGKEFELTRYDLTNKDSKQTCSRKCAAELRRQTNTAKYGGPAPASSADVRSKMTSTMTKRYGAAYATQVDQFKQKSKQTSLSRYGVEHAMQSSDHRQQASERWKDEEFAASVRAKIEATNLKKYGAKCVLSNSDVRNKCKATYKARTGYDTPWRNPEVRNKIKQSTRQHYGVEYPLQSDELKEQARQTNQARYGVDNPMQNDEIKARAADTCMDKYGNRCFLQSDQGKAAYRESMQTKYGTSYFSQSERWKQSTMLDPSKSDNLINFRKNSNQFIDAHFSDDPSIRELASELGIHENTAGQLIIEFGLENRIKYVYSYMEDEVFSMLKKIDPSATIIRNTHKIITPLELDIYLPEYNLAIECNPTSTHNSTSDSFTNGPSVIDYKYHQNKTNLCEQKGIFLFHIFGYDWTHRRNIIESMLQNLLGKSESRYFARNLDVRPVAHFEVKKFLEENHRQGYTAAFVALGLYNGTELVSLMTFGHMRNTIGTGSENLENCWELVRFCSKLDTTVIGGASKLFTHFVRDWKPDRIRSFSDRAHTKGNLYSTLGFTEVNRSDPNYMWVNIHNDRAYHRMNAQKRNIVKFLRDDTIDLNKTERQIMTEHGFVQVYDSGTITWEWSNNT